MRSSGLAAVRAFRAGRIRTRLLWTLGWFLLLLFALLPAAPSLLRVPSAAAGLPLYTGSQILQGQLLYRDIWIVNPPLGFYLSALGLLVGFGSRWGVWLLQLASLGAALVFLLAFLRSFFDRLSAGFAAAAFVANLVFFDPTFSSSLIFALPLQAAGWCLLARRQQHPEAGPLLPLALGVLAGLASSLDLALLSFGLVAGLGLLLADSSGFRPRRLLDLLWFAGGLALVWAVWLGFFAAHQVLPAFSAQVLRYPLFLSGVTNPDRLSAFTQVVPGLVRQSSFFLLACLAGLAVLPFLFLQSALARRWLTGRGLGLLMLLVGVGLLVNGWLDDVHGRFFALQSLSAYRLVLIAVGLLLAGLALPFLLGWVRHWTDRYAPPVHSSTGLLLPLALALLDLPLQLALATRSGQPERALFLPSLPSLTILFAFLIWSLRPVGQPGQARVFAGVGLAGLALLTLLPGLAATFDRLAVVQPSQVTQVVPTIQANSSSEDFVLQWGDEARLYFLSQRPAATRFAALQPLFNPLYATPERLRAFLNELQARPPRLLIDTRSDTAPLVLPQDLAQCDQISSLDDTRALWNARWQARGPLWQVRPAPVVPDGMNEVYRWLCERYEPLLPTAPDSAGWVIYRLKPAGSALVREGHAD